MPHLVKKGFLTTCLTTDSFGTHGNSGVKRHGEYAETNRNYRKWPEMYRKNLVQPFVYSLLNTDTPDARAK